MDGERWMGMLEVLEEEERRKEGGVVVVGHVGGARIAPHACSEDI